MQLPELIDGAIGGDEPVFGRVCARSGRLRQDDPSILREGVEAGARFGVDFAVVGAPEYEAPVETLETERLALDFAALEQRIPVIFRDAPAA